MTKPNIVLITIDSLRADFVGCYNHQEKNTPFLDYLASKSCIFTNTISPANPTHFAFSSIMTGVLPFTYGKYLGIPDDPTINTLAEVLKVNGYSTYAFLANSPALYSIYGYQRGFDYYNDGYEESNANRIYLYLLPFLWTLSEKLPDKLLRSIEIIRTFIKAAIFAPQHSIPGNKLNRKVINFFKRKGEKKYFLWLHYMDNHFPYSSGMNNYFFQEKNIIQRNINKFIFYTELTKSLRKMKIKNSKVINIFKEAYRAAVKYTDTCIKEIILYLINKEPNTIFVITSDHGEAFMEHGLFGHEALSLYNELINIPLIIYEPHKKARCITRTTSLVSIPKTIASLVGIKVKQFQGNSLLHDRAYSYINNISRILYKCISPHVRLGILDNKTEIKGYSELWSYTSAKEKYILEIGSNREEYYSLAKDPMEKINVAKNNMLVKSKAFKILKMVIEKYKNKKYTISTSSST